MTFKEIIDKVMGSKPAEMVRAELDGLHINHKRLDVSVNNLKAASDKVQAVASEFDTMIGRLVVDMGHTAIVVPRKGRANAKVNSRHGKT